MKGMNHVTSITLKLVFWYLFPIISFFAAKVVTSILSLRKRYAIKALDLTVPLIFYSIHQVSVLTFNESIFPYFLITICLLGIGLAFFQAYFYEEIIYKRYFKMFWRSVFLFSLLTHFIIVILSLILLLAH